MKYREKESILKLSKDQIRYELGNKIVKDELKYKNSVIVGDNGVGKTYLLEVLSEIPKSVLISCSKRGDVRKPIDTHSDIILIDNIEVGLEIEEIYDINSFLYKVFGDRKIIITTHNIELVSRLENYNIINMKETYYGVYDSNDFNTYDSVRNIMCGDIDIERETLVTLVNLKMCDKWTNIEEDKLNKLIESGLSKKDALLLEIF